MNIIKPNSITKFEKLMLILIYLMLIINYFVFHDSLVPVLSAFFGISYVFWAGKGRPNCYLYGLSGSGLYSLLSFSHAFWGHLILYIGYYVPMQILGFFKWKKNLQEGKNEIIKTFLSTKEKYILSCIVIISTIILSIILYFMHDTNPIFDGITTICSIAGMYLTVRRCIEQWIIWIIVNSLSAIMWFEIALSGTKVYSTVVMWCVYSFLAVYFYISWKKEIVLLQNNQKPEK